MTQIDLEDWLTSLSGDTPASPSRLPGSDEAIKMTDTSGRKCLELSKLSGRLGLLEKMLLDTSLWASTRCYLTWKPKDTKQGALLFRLSPQMPTTAEKGAGLWLTPNAMDALPPRNEAALLRQQTNNRKGRTSHSTLREQVVYPPPAEMWPTPAARDYKGMSGKGRQERKGNPKDTLPNAVGGSLNPQWVEWLMGYPVGYTDLDN